MILRLTKLPSEHVVGIYGKNEPICDKDWADGEPGPDYGEWGKLVAGTMPERARAMHPDAAVDYLRASEEMVVSDMLRSPQTSLHISQIPGRSALPPGKSGHNYGFSIDVHTRAMRSRLGLKSKRELDAWMAQFNFFNFWVDGRESHDIEDWHYNHFPAEFRDRDGGFASKVTTGYLENMIQRVYGEQLNLSTAGCQEALGKLGFDAGSPDGVVGRRTREATRGFQHNWMPKHQTGVLDDDTQRLLAFLTAEVEWVPLPAEMPQ